MDIHSHCLSVRDAEKSLKTSINTGLSEIEAYERLQTVGFNELAAQEGSHWHKILLSQLLNAMTVVLLLAMILSLAVKDYVEAFVIAFVIVTNTCVGFFQEYKAETTMNSLRKMSSPSAKVIRDGELNFIASRNLVPGDLIIFEEGDVIAADCRLIQVFNLEVDEALLTGESMAVIKDVHALELKDREISLGDRTNVCFSSTVVTKGRGKAFVFATRMDTQIGQIANALTHASQKRETTPLQQRLNKFALSLLVVAIILAVVVFSVNKWSFDESVALYAISLGIAVIPEGLVAVITMTMAFGVRKMATENALIRKISALEALGNVTNICSDKTGTITMNKMMATSLWVSGSGYFELEGQGYKPEGSIKCSTLLEENEKEASVAQIDKTDLKLAALSANLCNMSYLKFNESKNEWRVIGDPTEGALQAMAKKLDPTRVVTIAPVFSETKEGDHWKLLVEHPFQSSLKRMTVLCQHQPSGEFYLFSKGSTEMILKMCTKTLKSSKHELTGVSLPKSPADIRDVVPLTTSISEQVIERMQTFSRQGLRVLALAYHHLPKPNSAETLCKMDRETAEQNMTLIGLVGIHDPPRPESKASVLLAYEASISVHMLTGDHKLTAAAIAREVGILPPESATESQNLLSSESVTISIKSQDHLVMSGQEFDAMSDKEIDALDELPRVIARCNPQTKVNMINALHRRNRFVAMTGDGVNDSPSLKESDVGIAMGMAGSDVAKQASDIVLLDDNFSTIMKAIAEGRRIFNNIQKFLLHLMSTNVAEVITLLVGLAFVDVTGRSVYPMSPVQILYLNMVTSSPPAMGLGVEKALPKIMRAKPRRKEEGFFSVEILTDIFVYGILMGAFTLAVFTIVLAVFGSLSDIPANCNKIFVASCEPIYRSRATASATLTWLILAHAYNCRDLRRSVFKSGGLWKDNPVLFWCVFLGLFSVIPVIYVPWLNTIVFQQAPISWEWSLVIASVLFFMILSELYKVFKKFICRRLGSSAQAGEQSMLHANEIYQLA